MLNVTITFFIVRYQSQEKRAKPTNSAHIQWAQTSLNINMNCKVVCLSQSFPILSTGNVVQNCAAANYVPSPKVVGSFLRNSLGVKALERLDMKRTFRREIMYEVKYCRDCKVQTQYFTL